MNNNNFRPPFKPSFQPSFQPTPFRPQITGKTMIESKVINKSIIQKLFLLCSDNSISSIKDYILKTGITQNDMIDENGQSVIHIIIQNDTMNQSEKLELLTFFKNRGGIIESYDMNNNNYTPLHIACQKKLTKIVLLLIESGHNVNSLDSSNKTPIFYAITGIEEECPVKKVDYFIKQKNKLKLNPTDISAISDEVINILTMDSQFNQFIQHIYASSSTYDRIFREEIEDILKKNNVEITNIILENKSTLITNDKIKEVVSKTNQSIKSTLKNKFSQSTNKEFEIGITERGWSPDDTPQNTVLKDKNISDFKNNLENQAKNNLDEFKKKYQTKISELKTTFDSFRSNIDLNRNILNEILYMNYFYNYMINISNGTIIIPGVLPVNGFIDPTPAPNNLITKLTELNNLIQDLTNPNFVSQNLELFSQIPITDNTYNNFNIDTITKPEFNNFIIKGREPPEIQLIKKIITYFDTISQIAPPTPIIPILPPINYIPYTKLYQIIIDNMNNLLNDIESYFTMIDLNINDSIKIFTEIIPNFINKLLSFNNLS